LQVRRQALGRQPGAPRNFVLTTFVLTVFFSQILLRRLF
jgi:hypothetical protein